MADVVANGVRFHVQRMGGGDAAPVVFLHGLVMDNLSSWYFTVANRVATQRPVILYDLRGHGRSERPAGGYDLDTMVADLAALLDELGVARVALVGNSFGGQLALAFAAAHPARVERIALIDGHTGAAGWTEQMAATLELDGEERNAKIAKEFASWLGRHSERKRNRLARAAEALVYGTSLVADVRRSPALSDEVLARIECPVLALYGEQSDVLWCGKKLAELVPRCDLRVLPGCSHSVLWEAQDVVRDAIVKWAAPSPRRGEGQGGGRTAARDRTELPLTRPSPPPGERESRRYLLVVPPLTGHINPAISVAAELQARGHEVAWVGHPKTLRRLLPDDQTIFALDDELPAELVDRVSATASRVRGAERLKFLWEQFFVPLARAMVPGVEAAIDAFRPDALIVDQQTVAGAIAARRRGLPWITLATTSAGVVDPLAGLPKVRRWLDELMAELQREHGLPVGDLERSPHRVIAFTARELVGDGVEVPPQVAFVGPSITHRREPTPFPWRMLNGAPRVLVSLGTVNADAGDRFYREIVAAARAMDVQMILVAPDGMVAEPPDNVIVRSYVPQLALLAHVDAVVCHGGHNTVAEALAHGLPLVVAPIKDDQPVVAQQVEDAGVGVRVRFGRVRAGELRDAIARALGDTAMRAAAARMRESFNSAGGAARAAALVEELS